MQSAAAPRQRGVGFVQMNKPVTNGHVMGHLPLDWLRRYIPEVGEDAALLLLDLRDRKAAGVPQGQVVPFDRRGGGL